MRIQDRQGRGPDLLAAANDELVAAARKAPGLTQVFSPFPANTPQLFVDIDRFKKGRLSGNRSTRRPTTGASTPVTTAVGAITSADLVGESPHTPCR